MEKAMAGAGLKVKRGPAMDDDGILRRQSRGFSLSRSPLRSARTLAQWKDIYANRRMGTIGVREAQEILQKYERQQYGLHAGHAEDSGSGQADGSGSGASPLPADVCAGYLEEIAAALTSLEDACAERAVLPASVLGGKLGRAAKKANRRWPAEVFLADLQGRDERIRMQMQQLVDKTDILFGFTDDLHAGMSLGALMDKYPAAAEGFTAFLQKNGYRAAPADCWLEARSWSEDPARLLEEMRPLYRAKRGRKAQGEGTVPYPQVLGMLRRAVGEKKFAKLRPLIDFYRFAETDFEETRYVAEGFYMQLRRLWPEVKRAAGAGLDDPEDLRYLFLEELLEACRSGGPDESAMEKITRRRSRREEAVRQWEKMSGKKPARRAGKRETGKRGSA